MTSTEDQGFQLPTEFELPTPAPVAEEDAPRRVGRPAGARRQSPPREEPVRPGEVRADGPRLQRTRRRTEDRFYIDQQIVPQGITYEWKRQSVRGQPDPEHMNNLRENHWNPVPAARHRGIVVEKDGMILMERPSYLTQDARKEDLQIALEQVRGVSHAIAETPGGTMTRNHPSARANTRINHGYDMSIQGDNMIEVD